jgi:hypothetical protein
MRPEPAGRATAPKAASRWYGLSRRDPKAKLTLQVTYRGGSECWWLVTARGRSAVFPGHLCLHDVMREINRQF